MAMALYSGNVIPLHNIAVAKGLGFLRPFGADYLLIFEPHQEFSDLGHFELFIP